MVPVCLPCVLGRLEMHHKRQKYGEGQAGGGEEEERSGLASHRDVRCLMKTSVCWPGMEKEL